MMDVRGEGGEECEVGQNSGMKRWASPSTAYIRYEQE